MQLIFLGTGTAFGIEPGNYHSNLLLQADNGKRLLIDCGSDAQRALNKQGLSHEDITDVYISHLHFDHAGGLEWLGLKNKFANHPKKPNLYLHHSLCTLLWDHMLSASMNSIENQEACLADYFTPHAINEGNRFTWESIEFTLVPMIHISNTKKPFPTFGLLFSVADKTIFFTSDTQFTPERLTPYYQQADLILHDCETDLEKTGVHPRYEDLQTLDPAIKRKMWLYHYTTKYATNAVTNGFIGFAKPGQMLDLSAPETYLNTTN